MHFFHKQRSAFPPSCWMRLAPLGIFCLVALTAPAKAGLIDLQLVINPVQICRDADNCANPHRQLFEAHTDKVWAQAGIDIHFLDFQTFIDPIGYRLHPGEIDRYEPGTFEIADTWYDTAPGASSEPNVVNMFFVDEIVSPLPFSQILGIADVVFDIRRCFEDQGGRFPADSFFCADNYYEAVGNFAIADLTFESFDVGELVIAHEIGHILDLHHPNDAINPMFNTLFGNSQFPKWVVDDFESRDASNLMIGGGRFSAELEQLPPDSNFAGVLSPTQIDVARQSPFLIPFSEPSQVAVPLPSTLALLVFGMLGVGLRVRCDSRSRASEDRVFVESGFAYLS